MGSRGVYRGIHSSMLDDPDFQRLSAKSRHVLLTARLCRDAGPACIFRYYPAVLMVQTGYTRRQVDEALVELAKGDWVYTDGAVLWIRNGLRHDPQLRIGDKKHLKGVVRQVESLPASTLVAKFCDYYKIARPSNGPVKTKPVLPSDTDTDTEVLPDTDYAGKGLPARDRFDEFYSLFPRKKAPALARRAWNTAIKKASPDLILAALRRQLPDFGRRPSDRVPYPATWLNGEHWRNEPDEVSTADPYAELPALFDCKCGKAHAQRECDGLDAEESIAKWEKARRK